MRRNERLDKGGPAAVNRARNAARSLGALAAGLAATGRRKGPLPLAAFIIASAVTATGFFVPGIPLWLAAVPLIAPLVAGRAMPWLAAIAFAAFMLWPAALCAAGLVGIGFHPLLVWPAALMTVIALAGLAGLTGVAILTVTVTLVPVFAASPMLALADAVPGTGLAGPAALMTCLAIVEWIPGRRTEDLLHRAGIALMIIVGAIAWNLAIAAHPYKPGDMAPGKTAPMRGTHDIDAGSQTDPQSRAWREIAEPPAITEHGRWIALRDRLPQGSNVIMGENFFAATDDAAIAFWCDAARTRDLGLWIGVRVDQDQIRRGAVMRFDPQTCALPDPMPQIVHAAQRGIPAITGTWGNMAPLQAMAEGSYTPTGDASGGPDGDAPAPAWLICYEAFLAWSFVPVLAQVPQAPASAPIIVLSNDGAFGSLPVSRLRRKVTRAMAGLGGRTVLHADTGRTILVKGGSSRRIKGGSSRHENPQRTTR